MKRAKSSGQREVSAISRRCRIIQNGHLRLQPPGAGTTNVKNLPDASGPISGCGCKPEHAIFVHPPATSGTSLEAQPRREQEGKSNNMKNTEQLAHKYFTMLQL